MIERRDGHARMRALQVVVAVIFLVIAGRLAYLQLFDPRYDDLAKGNVLRHVVQYAPRGEVFDRNGEYLVQSRECYYLMAVWFTKNRAHETPGAVGWRGGVV